VRELAASYFHEYFLDSDGEKTLRSHSGPFSLARYGSDWITSEDDLWQIAIDLDSAPHFALFPKENLRFIRKADSMERSAGKLTEWKTSDKGT
jgi:hypothetical protein